MITVEFLTKDGKELKAEVKNPIKLLVFEPVFKGDLSSLVATIIGVDQYAKPENILVNYTKEKSKTFKLENCRVLLPDNKEEYKLKEVQSFVSEQRGEHYKKVAETFDI